MSHCSTNLYIARPSTPYLVNLYGIEMVTCLSANMLCGAECTTHLFWVGFIAASSRLHDSIWAAVEASWCTHLMLAMETLHTHAAASITSLIMILILAFDMQVVGCNVQLQSAQPRKEYCSWLGLCPSCLKVTISSGRAAKNAQLT